MKSLWFGKEKILKPAADGGGYLYVSLHKDNKAKNHKVHRLVANAFIENPEGLNEVNHKDEDKTNNTVDNLEWCSHKENCNYGTRNHRVAEANSIPIDMLTKDGEFIRQFPSAMEAKRYLRTNGFPKASVSHIIECCKGREHYNTAYGFKWRYAQGD